MIDGAVMVELMTGLVVAFVVYDAIGMLQRSMFSEYWIDMYDAYEYGGFIEE